MTKAATRAIETLEWLLLAAFSALLLGHTLPKAWKTLNTDFPNYYLAASLAHEGFDTSRMYEWRWLQRQKDHRDIDQPVIGLAPITPFSTLVVLPLTRFRPLQAKHIWTVLQLALLLSTILALRSLTLQPLRRIALLAVACIPLHRNLLYGQFYLLLLALMVAACWAYTRRMSTSAGILIAVAAMLKIFPAVFLLYFVRKRDWRALSAATVTMALCVALSIHIFGWQVHRVYLQTVLPWTLRGEAMPPYLLVSSSLSTLLHRLFVYEPQWNPHPWLNRPVLCAILGPALQAIILAPALLLVRSGRENLSLEWAALITATLTISTVPASYNFTLLLLPVVVLCMHLLPRRPLLAIAGVMLYIGIGYPSWNTHDLDGWHAILHVPRLYLLLLFTGLCYWTLAQASTFRWNRGTTCWSIGLAAAACLGIFFGVRGQRGMYDDYAYRLPTRSEALMATDPMPTHGIVQQIELTANGYRLANQRNTAAWNADTLSFAGDWVEETTTQSRILGPGGNTIEDAHSPVLSPDGRSIAYLRDTLGTRPTAGTARQCRNRHHTAIMERGGGRIPLRKLFCCGCDDGRKSLRDLSPRAWSSPAGHASRRGHATPPHHPTATGSPIAASNPAHGICGCSTSPTERSAASPMPPATRHILRGSPTLPRSSMPATAAVPSASPPSAAAE